MGDTEITPNNLAKKWLSELQEDIRSAARQVTVDDWLKADKALEELYKPKTSEQQ